MSKLAGIELAPKFIGDRAQIPFTGGSFYTVKLIRITMGENLREETKIGLADITQVL